MNRVGGKMQERIAVIEGIRTPFCKAGGVFKEYGADDLGAIVVKELLARAPVKSDEIDELIFGNVIQPPHATNIARVLAVKGGLPVNIPSYTVNRNCASGMEAVTSAANKILNNQANIIIAGGAESMSNVPILFPNKMRDFLFTMSKAKTFWQKIKLLFTLRPSFFKPSIPGLLDPLCDLTMGQTAEIVSRDFKVTRKDQDEYALKSQERAVKAQEDGTFAEEIIPLPIPPKYDKMQTVDDGVRKGGNLESLAKLKPVFEKETGTVTAGNSSQVTDGAVALLLMRESEARKRGLHPIGYIRDYSVAALEPQRMGLGPAYAITKLLDKTGLKISDIDLFEINEAFAAQVIGVVRALASDEFSKKQLGKDKAVGTIDFEKLNVGGGAISLGHPVGASGARIILNLLKELKRRELNRGIASLCIGGGQGEAVLLEVK